jgi:hypothetical protein
MPYERMSTDRLYEDPDEDIAKEPIRIRQFLSILSLGIVVAVLWAVGWFSGRSWPPHATLWLLVTFVYLGERHLFIGRLFELNERLRRIEHKVNAQKDL